MGASGWRENIGGVFYRDPVTNNRLACREGGKKELTGEISASGFGRGNVTGGGASEVGEEKAAEQAEHERTEQSTLE